MAKNLTNEVRPDVKGDKKGHAHNEYWNTVEQASCEEKKSCIPLVLNSYFNIEKEYDDKGKLTDIYAVLPDDTKIIDMATLKSYHEFFLDQLEAYRILAEDLAKKTYLEYIDADRKSENETIKTLSNLRWKLSDGLSLEYRTQKKSSDKDNYKGMVLVNANTKDEVAFYKYAINTESMSFNKLRTTWESTEAVAKYEAALIRAEKEKQAAEKREREAAAASKAKDEELAQLKAQVEMLLKQMQMQSK